MMDPLVDEYIKAFPLHVYFQKHLWFFGLVGKNHWMDEEGT